MPVAQKQDTFIEESQYLDDQRRIPQLPSFDSDLFKEIKHLIDQARVYNIEEEEDRRKIKKLEKHMEIAQETVEKAEKKYEQLKKQNDLLILNSAESSKKIEEAIEYWKNFGLDVKQISDEQYEFIFTKLKQGSEEENKYIVGVKHQDKRLEIVLQEPEVLDADIVCQLTTRLNSNCIRENGTIDWRSTVIMIRKDLIKSLSP